jgi:hypothetical protein
MAQRPHGVRQQDWFRMQSHSAEAKVATKQYLEETKAAPREVLIRVQCTCTAKPYAHLHGAGELEAFEKRRFGMPWGPDKNLKKE